MKITFVYIACFCFSYTLAAQNTIQWSDSIVVDATTRPITAPRIALFPDGTPIISWGVNGDFVNNPAQIWCSRFENGVFTPASAVVQTPDEPLLYGFGGYDMALSDSLVFIVFEQSQQGIFLTSSGDRGDTFGPPSAVQESVANGYAILASVAADGTGNPIVSYILHKNNDTDYLVRRSMDGGLSFNEAPVPGNASAAGTAVCECCTSDLLASGDSVWLLFRNNNQDLRDIWVSRSTDLAATFDTATDVDATDWHLNFCPVAGPRMARSGDSLITIWMSGASGTSRVYLSTLHAATMQAGQQLDFPSASDPQISQSQADLAAKEDTVGVVFVENGKEILFHFSTQGVAGLAAENDRFTEQDHTLQLPSVVFRDGVFHLVYVDATSREVLYRRGILSGNSPANEPKLGSTADISVWPNPIKCGGKLLITSNTTELLEVSLYDVSGTKIFAQRPDRQAFNLLMDQVPKGLYFLNLTTRSAQAFRKIIVH